MWPGTTPNSAVCVFFRLCSPGFCPVTDDLYENGIPTPDGATGIQGVTSTKVAETTGRIYSVDGRFVGTNRDNLSKGMYIMDGQKFIVK